MDDFDELDHDTSSVFPGDDLVKTSVFARGLSALCTKQDVHSFFSFCGNIEHLRLRKSSGDHLEALLVFDSESAQQTALLLHGSSILDQEFTIEPAPTNWNAMDEKQSALNGSEQKSNEQVSNSEGSNVNPSLNPSAFLGSGQAGATAAGWNIGSSMSSWWQSAKQFANEEMEAYQKGEYQALLKEAVDYTQQRAGELSQNVQTRTRELQEKYELNQKLNQSAAQFKELSERIDRQMAISETSDNIRKISAERMKELDENLHLTQRIHQAADGALSNESVSNLISDINERTRELWQQAGEIFRDHEQASSSAPALKSDPAPSPSSTATGASSEPGAATQPLAPSEIASASVDAPSSSAKEP